MAKFLAKCKAVLALEELANAEEEQAKFLANGEVRSRVSASGMGAGDLLFVSRGREAADSDAVRGGSLVGRPSTPMG